METNPEMTKSEPIAAADLIKHFERFRDVRKLYAKLEKNRYKAEWSALETSDGGKGDVGEAALNELRLRNRYPMKGALEDPNADPALQMEKLKADAAHEVVDLIWSTVRMADLLGADAEAICLEASPFEGTARQALTKYSLAAGALDELIDPPAQPMFNHDLSKTEEQLVNDYLKGEFEAAVSLANTYESEYGINLAEAVATSMDGLERRIPTEHIPEQV